MKLIIDKHDVESALSDMLQASSVVAGILDDLLMYENINADLLKLKPVTITAKVSKIKYLIRNIVQINIIIIGYCM